MKSEDMRRKSYLKKFSIILFCICLYLGVCTWEYLLTSKIGVLRGFQAVFWSSVMLPDGCGENRLTFRCAEAGITVERSELNTVLVLEGSGEIFSFSKQDFFGFHTLAE